jgi:hypothetical protein
LHSRAEARRERERQGVPSPSDKLLDEGKVIIRRKAGEGEDKP